MRQPRRRTPRLALFAAMAGMMASTAFAGAAVAKKTDPADVEQAFHKAEVTNEDVNSIGVRIDATVSSSPAIDDHSATTMNRCANGSSL